MRCMDCGSEMRWTTERIVEEYRGVRVSAEGIGHFVCDGCGEYELDAKEAKKLSLQLASGFARAKGLLTPLEIRAIRKGLGLTQTQFEKILGVSTPTASRWETGAMVPSKSVCKLMMLLSANPELVDDTRENAFSSTEAFKPMHKTISGWKAYQGGSAAGEEDAARHRPSVSSTHSVIAFEVKEG